MRARLHLLTVCIFCVFITNILAQTERYGVYYKAFPWTLINDTNWLDNVVQYWGATGVELEVVWRIIEPNPPTPEHVYDWTQLDRALDILIEKDVDLSFRVRMGSLLPDWVDFQDSDYESNKPADNQTHNGIFHLDDFQIDKNGDHVFYTMTNDNANRFFNLCSPSGVKEMKTFLRAVVNHIHDYLHQKSYNFSAHRYPEFMPNINFDSELELRAGWIMTGYSTCEIEAFRSYLRIQYNNDIKSLRKRWNRRSNERSIRKWADIQPLKYNWHQMENMSFSDYDYPQGRIDWLKFRFKNLREFADSLAVIINQYGFRMGVQLGSIYDSRIDYRGFLDPTEFLRYAYALRLADIRSYRDHFDFGADYARSICRFWEAQDGISLRGFSSETNGYGFGFDGNLSDEENSRLLAADWIRQIRAYYKRGSDRHTVIGWGNTEGASVSVKAGKQIKKIAQTDLIDDPDVQRWYAEFRNELQSVNKKVNPNKKNVPKRAIHLNANYFPYAPEMGVRSRRTYTSFPFHEAVRSKGDHKDQARSYSGEMCDFITDFMIETDPKYLMNYSGSGGGITFSRTSEYISDKAYENLLRWTRRINSIQLHHDPSLRKDDTQPVIPGSKNDYGENRATKLNNDD